MRACFMGPIICVLGNGFAMVQAPQITLDPPSETKKKSIPLPAITQNARHKSEER